MDLYGSLKTIHMVAGAGLFASLGFQVFTVRRLRRVGEVREARRAFGQLRTGVRAGLVASAAILIPGVWMMALRWGAAPWIVAALVGVAVMVVAAVRARPTMASLDAALREPSDRLPEALDAVASGRPVQALWVQSTIAIGVVTLMFAKPGWLGSRDRHRTPDGVQDDEAVDWRTSWRTPLAAPGRGRPRSPAGGVRARSEGRRPGARGSACGCISLRRHPATRAR